MYSFRRRDIPSTLFTSKASLLPAVEQNKLILYWKKKINPKTKRIRLEKERASILLCLAARKCSSEIIEPWALGELRKSRPITQVKGWRNGPSHGRASPAPLGNCWAAPSSAWSYNGAVSPGCLAHLEVFLKSERNFSLGSGWLILSLLQSTLKGCLLG